MAFRLWGDALRQTQLQLYKRKLRREAAEAKRQAMTNRAEAEAAQADRAKKKGKKSRSKAKKAPRRLPQEEEVEEP